MTALEAAESVVLPVYPEIAALRAMHSLLELLQRRRVDRPKATFVLNHMFAKDILKPRDVESALGSADRDRPAVRRVRLPQGRQRGRPGASSARRARRPPSGSSS